MSIAADAEEEDRYERALVTGASSGIGEAFARALAARGTDLVLVARRKDRLEVLADALRGRSGVAVDVLAADLTEPMALNRVAARLTDEDSPVDLLVNNAGFGSSGNLVDIDAERLADEVNLNVGAVVTLTRTALPGMVARGRGAVVNVSSIAGFMAMPKQATYYATKSFVTTFTEGIAEELRGTGVQIQALCPGLTRTEFKAVSADDGAELPAFMWQQAEEVVKASLDGLERGSVIVVPGKHNKGLVTAAGIAPRAVRRRAVRVVQRLRQR